MFWLIGPLLVVALLVFTGFRKTAAGVLVVTLVAGVWLYRHNAAVEAQAMSSQWAKQIALENVKVRRTFDATYEISGRVTNNLEDRRIDAIALRVRLRDCPAGAAAECRPMGVATADVAITLFPRQTREFVGTLYYGKGQAPPEGSLAWDYEITAIRARRQ